MTINETIQWANQNPNPIIIYMICVPALAFILSMFLDKNGHESPGKYLFSAVIYAAAVPGTIAIILSGYDMIFRRADLKNMNMLVYFLPILSMFVSIAFVRRVVDLQHIPGVKRLTGFLLMLGVTGIISFILQKMFIGVIFFGSVYTFLGIFVILFILIRVGWEKAFG